MLRGNLDRIFAETETLPRVLDVGGIFSPLNTATHIVDVMPYGSLRGPLDPNRPTRFSAETFSQFDICRKPWPFSDKFFDYSFCAHTLEDVRDPIGAAEELMRVSKAGYVEVPSRMRESFHYKRGYFWRRIIGRPIRVGWEHHRWLCERSDTGLVFTAKTNNALFSRNFFITVEEAGRQLTPDEANIGLFWTGNFTVEERMIIEPGAVDKDLARFKAEALARIHASI